MTHMRTWVLAILLLSGSALVASPTVDAKRLTSTKRFRRAKRADGPPRPDQGGGAHGAPVRRPRPGTRDAGSAAGSSPLQADTERRVDKPRRATRLRRFAREHRESLIVLGAIASVLTAIPVAVGMIAGFHLDTSGVAAVAEIAIGGFLVILYHGPGMGD